MACRSGSTVRPRIFAAVARALLCGLAAPLQSMASMSESLVEFVSGGTGPGPPEGVLARALGTDSSRRRERARTLSIPVSAFPARAAPTLTGTGASTQCSPRTCTACKGSTKKDGCAKSNPNSPGPRPGLRAPQGAPAQLDAAGRLRARVARRAAKIYWKEEVDPFEKKLTKSERDKIYRDEIIKHSAA